MRAEPRDDVLLLAGHWVQFPTAPAGAYFPKPQTTQAPPVMEYPAGHLQLRSEVELIWETARAGQGVGDADPSAQ